MPTEVEIKKCPFCGGQSSVGMGYKGSGENEQEMFYVECEKCAASSDGFTKDEGGDIEAVDVWNKREGSL